jgi:hypothetical protein
MIKTYNTTSEGYKLLFQKFVENMKEWNACKQKIINQKRRCANKVIYSGILFALKKKPKAFLDIPICPLPSANLPHHHHKKGIFTKKSFNLTCGDCNTFLMRIPS